MGSNESPFFFMANEDESNTESADPNEPKLDQLTDVITSFGLYPMYQKHVCPVLEDDKTALMKGRFSQSYKHYIKDLPGKSKIEPNKFIRGLIENPSTSTGYMSLFDKETLKEAFNFRPCSLSSDDLSQLGIDDFSSFYHSSANGINGIENGIEVKYDKDIDKKEKVKKKKLKNEYSIESPYDEEHRKKKKRKKENEEMELDIID